MRLAKNLALARSDSLSGKGTTEDEMSTEDRRAPGATRIPFDGLGRGGGALGPAFEAQAVNVSEEGMRLRTAYLPEVGQALLCRFDAGALGDVNAPCEVVWREEGERGGEFGLRFVDLDAQSADALGRIVGVREKVIQPSGAKVRLHIEGLGFPMRARVKDARARSSRSATSSAFSRWARSSSSRTRRPATKRPARIDRVEVAVDSVTSNVPQLVVDAPLLLDGQGERGRRPGRSAAPEATHRADGGEAPPTIRFPWTSQSSCG